MTGVRYFIGERDLSDTQNRLSCIAYQGTKDIVKGSPRIGVADLKPILAKLGVEDPEGGKPWKVTLPNGIVVGCKADSGVASKAKAPAKAAAKKAPAKKAAPAPKRTKPTVASVDLLKKAAARLVVAGRGSGPEKITVTRENAEAILAAPVDELKTWPSDVKAS